MTTYYVEPQIKTLPSDDTSFSIMDVVAPYEENGDPDHRTHIVRPVENKHIHLSGMSSQDIVDMARLHRVEITALCGYTFIPKHNPEKFDACEACMTIAGNLMRGNNE